MNFVILKSQMLYYVLVCFIMSVIRCHYLDKTNDEVTESSVFQNGSFWSVGDIPLLNRKIFKGTRVTIREHPYIASIRRQIMHYSVATMLTKNIFITVAHPLADVPIDEIGVVVGENYADRGATLLTVLLVITHENFDPYTLAADLALLKVYEDTPSRCSVKIIQLVHPNETLTGQQALVTGWGRCDRMVVTLPITFVDVIVVGRDSVAYLRWQVPNKAYAKIKGIREEELSQYDSLKNLRIHKYPIPIAFPNSQLNGQHSCLIKT